jgi:hypothetical protein
MTGLAWPLVSLLHLSLSFYLQTDIPASICLISHIYFCVWPLYRWPPQFSTEVLKLTSCPTFMRYHTQSMTMLFFLSRSPSPIWLEDSNPRPPTPTLFPVLMLLISSCAPLFQDRTLLSLQTHSLSAFFQVPHSSSKVSVILKKTRHI